MDLCFGCGYHSHNKALEHLERKIMTNINEAVALEEGKRVTMDESSIRQRTNLEKPTAVN
jgi:hypothetical protein